MQLSLTQSKIVSFLQEKSDFATTEEISQAVAHGLLSGENIRSQICWCRKKGVVIEGRRTTGGFRFVRIKECN